MIVKVIPGTADASTPAKPYTSCEAKVLLRNREIIILLVKSKYGYLDDAVVVVRAAKSASALLAAGGSVIVHEERFLTSGTIVKYESSEIVISMPSHTLP